MLLASRFKVLCANAGLSIDEGGKLLHVTPRTVRNWFTGRAAVPYAAYKLVRVQRWFELPGDAWQGWHFAAGKLWTPEGHGFDPADSSWWGLLTRKAALFEHLYQRQRDFDIALLATAGRADEPARPTEASGPADGRSGSTPTGAAGRAAQPPGPKLISMTLWDTNTKKRGATEEKPSHAPTSADTNKEGVSHG